MKKPWIGLLAVVLVALWLWLATPRWLLNQIKRVDLSDPVATGAALVEKYGCRRCHTIDGKGGLYAPDLAGVTERHDELVLRLWLQNPRKVKANTAMPNFKLSDSEIDALVAYFRSLDAQK